VKLLLDQNLAPRLVASLANLYPNSTHVRDVGLATADDDAVWRHAADEGFTIVSKDADFHERSFLLGPPSR
jgi:predicted nuclease of predicted toxin-antitoxin system